MRDDDTTVIVDAVRTPVGRRGGALSGVHPVDLSADVLQALVRRTGLDPARVQDVVWGCVSQTGEQAVNVARNAVLAAGWPEHVPGVSIDRQCGSGQKAVHLAVAMVASGQAEVVVAGGVESMSRVPMLCTVTQGPGIPFGPRMSARYDGALVPQGASAEILATRWGLHRQECDELALRSHELAACAQDSGHFDAELLTLPQLDRDEGVRRGGSMHALGQLRTVFAEDGVVTAGNSSQISDGAAALLVTTAAVAAELGVEPLARVAAVASAGVDPVTMLSASAPATLAALRRAGLSSRDVHTLEVNEAFATVLGAWLCDVSDAGETRQDLLERTNLSGGAIALGHPLGASGARIMTTLLHRMRREGLRYGLQTMCEGGGMADATLLELC